MPDLKTSILIVEDEESVRTSLAMVLSVLGHRVRSASDGLAALIEMRQESPDILLSDLNMPGMSGFELLSVVRRRFPAVRVIAMSGAFSGEQVPLGVTADAFYPKGYGVDILMRAISSLPLSGRQPREMPEPIWIQRNGHDPKGAEFVTIACPDCFKDFPAGDQRCCQPDFRNQLRLLPRLNSIRNYRAVGSGISATLSTCSTLRVWNPVSPSRQLTTDGSL